ncbi:transposase [Nocardia sp. KC 131]|uniref:transposase n=1 Tax=Nocardia arseniciresistens TaxID=3392119 RepID=UPI00398F3803
MEDGAPRKDRTPCRATTSIQIVYQRPDARALKSYAGSAPVTRASGKSISISYRRIKNDRLAAVGWVRAAVMVMNPGPAQQHYRQRRQHGDRHAPAVRHLVNKMLGQLYHCLQTHQVYDPVKASDTPPPNLKHRPRLDS